MLKNLLNDCTVYSGETSAAFLQALEDGQKSIEGHSESSFSIVFDSRTAELELIINRISQRNDYADLFGPGDVPGYLTDGDMLAIAHLSKKVPNNGMIVEVGSFLGKSAVEWARGIESDKKSCQIICIDSFNAPPHILKDLLVTAEFTLPSASSQLEMFRHYTSAFDNIKALEAFFNQDFEFDQLVDLVFEDSTHTSKYLTYALPFWWSKVKAGGILSGHDYSMREVQVSVDTFALLNNLKVNTFPNSSIWYMKK